MDKGRKIRNLVETDNLAVSLEDIINKAVGMTSDMVNLEYGNKKTHYNKVWKGIRELESEVIKMKRRINNEVFEEVHAYAEANKHKYPGNVEHLKKKDDN